MKNNKWVEGIICTLITIPSIFFGAWILQLYWEWFIMSTFNVTNFPYMAFVGITMFKAALFGKGNLAFKNDLFIPPYEVALKSLMLNCFMLIFGYIIKLIFF